MAENQKQRYFCGQNYKWINNSDGTACLKGWIKIRITLVKQSSSVGRLTPRDKMEMPLAFHPTENMLLKEEVKVDIISRERE